jgi:hypothetical protein
MPPPFARRVPARSRARDAGTQVAPLLDAVRDNAFVGVAAAMLGGVLWVEAADLPDAPIPAVARCGSREIPALREGA